VCYSNRSPLACRIRTYFFSIKESHESRVEKKKKEKQEKQVMEEEMKLKEQQEKLEEEKEREVEAQSAKKRQKVASVGASQEGNRRKPRRLGI